jgi:hypothetical protein
MQALALLKTGMQNCEKKSEPSALLIKRSTMPLTSTAPNKASQTGNGCLQPVERQRTYNQAILFAFLKEIGLIVLLVAAWTFIEVTVIAKTPCFTAIGSAISEKFIKAILMGDRATLRFVGALIITGLLVPKMIPPINLKSVLLTTTYA